MSREELINKIAKDADLTKKAAGKALKAVLEGITLSLEKKEKVTLVGFGTFNVSHRKERKGVNPQNGKRITIPARDVPVFKPGKKLKDAVK